VNTPYPKQASYKISLNRKTPHNNNKQHKHAKDYTLATKKPSATDAKLRSPPLVGDALLSPILEDNKEDDLLTMPEIQGRIDNKTLTIDDPMEPLSDQPTERLPTILH
jgi:hypothetical protein